MAVVVNTPSGSGDSGGTNGILMVLLIIVFFLILVYFGLPLLRRAATPSQVNIPDNIDVNVNAPNPGQ